MNIQKKQIFKFFKQLNFGLKNKKKYIVGNKFKNFDLLLIYLFEMRLIKNYKINETSTFQIELAYDMNGNSIIKGIRNAPQRRYKEHISFKNLNMLANKKTPIYMFLETREGVLPWITCINYKIGGNLLFWIY